MATVEGGQAELPCDIASGPGDRDNVYLVLWYRKDSGTPIYRYKLSLSYAICLQQYYHSTYLPPPPQVQENTMKWEGVKIRTKVW